APGPALLLEALTGRGVQLGHDATTLLVYSGGSVIDNLVAVYRDVSSYDALSTNLLGCATNNLRDVVTSVFGVPNPVEIPGVNAGEGFLAVADGIKGAFDAPQINWLIANPAKPGTIRPHPTQQVNDGGAT